MVSTPEDLPTVWIGGADFYGDLSMFAVDGRNGELFAAHVSSSFEWGLHDVHNRVPHLYQQRFGGFGDGKFYRIVCVDSWSDVPQHVRDMNNALADTETRDGD